MLNLHVLFYSESSKLDVKRKTALNIADALEGFFPKYVANKDLKTELIFQER